MAKMSERSTTFGPFPRSPPKQFSLAFKLMANALSRARLFLGAIALTVSTGCSPDNVPSPTPSEAAACEWANAELFIADTNLLTPYRMRLDPVDPGESGQSNPDSNDLEFTATKAVRGGLDLAVLEILVTSADLGHEQPVAKILAELNALKAVLETTRTLRVALASANIKNVENTDRLDSKSGNSNAVVLAIENAAFLGSLDSPLDGLEQLYDEGVRLMTPVHSRPNQFGDSSYSEDRPHQGLSKQGQTLIARMNELGIIIDVSHMSDESVRDVAESTKAPVIASHSGVRKFTPGWERNVDDETMRLIASTDGVVHVPFSGSFLSQAVKDEEQAVWDHVEGQGLSINSLEGRAQARQFRNEQSIGYGDVSDVLAQIDHVVDTVGIDHVGIGSGFDGSGDSMVDGLKDASSYANLAKALCEAGYERNGVEKIMGGNFVRVWNGVERVARSIMDR